VATTFKVTGEVLRLVPGGTVKVKRYPLLVPSLDVGVMAVAAAPLTLIVTESVAPMFFTSTVSVDTVFEQTIPGAEFFRILMLPVGINGAGAP
jgi:hypothetical protein